MEIQYRLNFSNIRLLSCGNRMLARLNFKSTPQQTISNNGKRIMQFCYLTVSSVIKSNKSHMQKENYRRFQGKITLNLPTYCCLRYFNSFGLICTQNRPDLSKLVICIIFIFELNLVFRLNFCEMCRFVRNCLLGKIFNETPYNDVTSIYQSCRSVT